MVNKCSGTSLELLQSLLLEPMMRRYDQRILFSHFLNPNSLKVSHVNLMGEFSPEYHLCSFLALFLFDSSLQFFSWSTNRILELKYISLIKERTQSVFMRKSAHKGYIGNLQAIRLEKIEKNTLDFK